jgi:hypothetical protein
MFARCRHRGENAGFVSSLPLPKPVVNRECWDLAGRFLPGTCVLGALAFGSLTPYTN